MKVDGFISHVDIADKPDQWAFQSHKSKWWDKLKADLEEDFNCGRLYSFWEVLVKMKQIEDEG